MTSPYIIGKGSKRHPSFEASTHVAERGERGIQISNLIWTGLLYMERRRVGGVRKIRRPSSAEEVNRWKEGTYEWVDENVPGDSER